MRARWKPQKTANNRAKVQGVSVDQRKISPYAEGELLLSSFLKDKIFLGSLHGPAIKDQVKKKKKDVYLIKRWEREGIP